MKSLKRELQKSIKQETGYAIIKDVKSNGVLIVQGHDGKIYNAYNDSPEKYNIGDSVTVIKRNPPSVVGKNRINSAAIKYRFG